MHLERPGDTTLIVVDLLCRPGFARERDSPVRLGYARADKRRERLLDRLADELGVGHTEDAVRRGVGADEDKTLAIVETIQMHAHRCSLDDAAEPLLTDGRGPLSRSLLSEIAQHRYDRRVSAQRDHSARGLGDQAAPMGIDQGQFRTSRGVAGREHLGDPPHRTELGFGVQHAEHISTDELPHLVAKVARGGLVDLQYPLPVVHERGVG